jgi:hypothetical protein
MHATRVSHWCCVKHGVLKGAIFSTNVRMVLKKKIEHTLKVKYSTSVSKLLHTILLGKNPKLGQATSNSTFINYLNIWIYKITHKNEVEFHYSQSQSHITTDNQSASLSWCQATSWDPRPILLSPWDFLLDSYCLLFCSALSDERTGL